MFHYESLGFELESEFELPMLRSCTRETPRVSFFKEGSRQSPAPKLGEQTFVKKNERGVDYLTVSSSLNDGLFEFSYWDKTRFIIDAQEKSKAIRVFGERPEDTSLPYFLTYLSGPVLGYCARLLGNTVLHASAIEYKNKTLVFCGHGGAGKSSLATRFGLDGNAVITDDLCALTLENNRYRCEPGPKRIRLWQESEQALFEHALPAIAPDWEKKFASKEVPFSDARLPIGAIFILTGPLGKAEKLSPMHASMSLLSQIYSEDFSTTKMKKRDLEVITELVQSVPVFTLPRNENITQVGLRKATAIKLYEEEF